MYSKAQLLRGKEGGLGFTFAYSDLSLDRSYSGSNLVFPRRGLICDAI